MEKITRKEFTEILTNNRTVLAGSVFRWNDEKCIAIEIAADEALTRETVYRIIEALKDGLNQESVMYKMVESDVDFI